MNILLRKTLVDTFYRQNAGLLWIVGLLAGGFMRQSDHVALAEYAVTSGLVLGLYVAVWLLYSLFATHFAVRQLGRYPVFLHLRLFSVARRWGGLGLAQAMLMAPAIGYALFVYNVARHEGQSWATGVIFGSLFVIWLGTLGLYEYALRHPNRVGRVLRWVAGLRRQYQTPYNLFLLRHLLNAQATLFWRTKVGTCLVWIGILKLYATDHYQFNLLRTPDYDLRLLSLGTLLVGLGHATVVYEQYRFEHTLLPIYRNMPLSDWQRWARYVVTFALLLIPELALLLFHLPVNEPVWLSLGTWVFGLSVLCLWFGMLLRVHRDPNRTMVTLYILLIVYFLLIMFRVPVWPLAGLTLGIASWLFKRYYWQSAWQDEPI